MLVFATFAYAQNRETVIGCIAGNVTMAFKPKLVAGKEVKTYVWNKVRGIYKDPSFAKFEPNISSELQTYFNEEHQVQNRLYHYPEEPDTLYLTDLRKSDEQQYTLVISYVNYVGTPTEYIIDLVVKDVCFENPKEVGKCAVTTCYTGDGGTLKMPGSKEQAVKGYELVKVCDEMTTGNYSCCNAAGTCLVQLLQESMGDTMPPDGLSNNTAIIAVVIVVVILVVIAVVLAVVFIKKRKDRGNQVPDRETQDEQKIPL